VIWFTGNDGMYGESISPAEQSVLSAYLESGGHLFINGSDIGYDLGLMGSSADNAFYSLYLKAVSGGDQPSINVAEGAIGSIFAGQAIRFGQNYREAYPDVVDPAGGSAVCIRYPSGAAAGIQYAGAFGQSSQPGALVHIGFPIETIADDSCFNGLVAAVVEFFDAATVGVDGSTGMPLSGALEQNHPNPFNPMTNVDYRLSIGGAVRLSIFDLLGREIAVLVNEEKPPGSYTVTWDATGFSSGVYFYTLTAGTLRESKRMIFMK
jgi:hypothetical protein